MPTKVFFWPIGGPGFALRFFAGFLRRFAPRLELRRNLAHRA